MSTYKEHFQREMVQIVRCLCHGALPQPLMSPSLLVYEDKFMTRLDWQFWRQSHALLMPYTSEEMQQEARLKFISESSNGTESKDIGSIAFGVVNHSVME